jgi:hypothetical protein
MKRKERASKAEREREKKELEGNTKFIPYVHIQRPIQRDER